MIRMTLALVLATAVAVPYAGAQNAARPPGARPPVVPASSTPTLHPIGVPGMTPAAPAAPAASPVASPDAPDAADPPAAAPHARRLNRPQGMVAPPPAQATVQSGVNATMGIAFDYPNRIVTPFAHPEVKTNSTASITVEGSIVYVSTNADAPVSMFVHDRGRGDPAISLTLIPEPIPAVSTRINIRGFDNDAADGLGGRADASPAAPASAELAHTFETSTSYVATLVAIMKELARGRVPDGYSFRTLHGTSPLMPTCTMPGLALQPAQLLGGSAFDVIVARATNATVSPVTVKEDGCVGDQVRAVAAWPDRIVRPGANTEIYIVLVRPDAGDDDARNTRPTVIGAR